MSFIPGAAVLGPRTFSVKAAVLTAGAPADIATIDLPIGYRYAMAVANSPTAGGGKIVAESAAGTLAAASFNFRDAAAGGGLQLTLAIAGPAGVGGSTANAANNTNGVYIAAGPVYVYQTANSANAGTCAFSFTAWPLP